MNWLTISINPPKIGVPIVARGDDKFGFGAKMEVFNFEANLYNELDAEMHLRSHSFIEWLELPE